MNKKDDFLTHEPRRLQNFDSDLPENSPRFSPEQMIKCEECERQNPPSRMSCIYCGKQIEISENNAQFARPVIRKLEYWEKGFNVLLQPQGKLLFDESFLREMSQYLRVESETLSGIFKTNLGLPIARVETAGEAELIQKKLGASGILTTIISDEIIAPEQLPRRVRFIEFGDELLIKFIGKDETETLNWNDLKVLVVGRLFETRKEATEKRKSGETMVLDSSEFSSDEKVFDFYTKTDSIGFRVAANNFDFSCLGGKKQLLARENFRILIEELRKGAPELVFDDNYMQLRNLINSVWEIAERKESTGWAHEGIGKIKLGSVLTMNNHNQFLRYSRSRSELLKS